MKARPAASEKAKATVQLYKEKIPKSAVADQQPLSSEPVQQPPDLTEEYHEQPQPLPEPPKAEIDVPHNTVTLSFPEGSSWWEDGYEIPKVHHPFV